MNHRTVKLDNSLIELDLHKNIYISHSIEKSPVSFDCIAHSYRDFSKETYEGSADFLKLPDFCIATLKAWTRRNWPIQKIADEASKICSSMEMLSPTSELVISDYFATYRRLKVWLPKPLSCLPDTLASLYFIENLGASASFVIGVKEDPFLAHAWLVVNGVIANDTIARTSVYKTILRCGNDRTSGKS